MLDLLDAWLFHWTPGRAIWIDGHTLSWDARCAGIYAGFALAALYQLAAGWRAWQTPALRPLLTIGLFALPLLADVLGAALGYWPPSNDARYATGLLFGGVLAVALVPAVLTLAGFGGGSRHTGGLRYFAPLLPLLAAAFLLKSWQSIIAFGIIEALCYAGCLALVTLLGWGLWLLARRPRTPADTARLVVLLALVLLLPGCAAPLRVAEPRACDTASFVPAPVPDGVCQREVCRDGKVELAEDLDALAPVDDWAEERFCALRPFSCLQAYRMKKDADRWLKTLEGTHWDKKEVRYGVGDAVRHAYLMCLYAERFGAEFARGLGIAHEADSGYLIFSRMGEPSNHCCERHMDLYNNEVGISLAGRPGSCEEKAVAASHLLRHSICERKGDQYLEE